MKHMAGLDDRLDRGCSQQQPHGNTESTTASASVESETETTWSALIPRDYCGRQFRQSTESSAASLKSFKCITAKEAEEQAGPTDTYHHW
ncbi:hypothetical protein NLG97_g10436 [Lecanicillium saksenae]|uniref:Uncharacterized protein n=1 Tax=Lecanicillium saksenae TaxID=468837 RepID=A0ACC1QH23_9HYPO|nr:hypothetical protein NLG97_g10436 [Lecanicillium saksenae]